MTKKLNYLLCVFSLLSCGLLKASTLTAINLTGIPTNFVSGSAMIFPAGRTEIFLTSAMVADLGLVAGIDYQWVYDLSSVAPVPAIVPVDATIQDSFNRGLYFSSVIVSILLMFYMMRSAIPSGREES